MTITVRLTPEKENALREEAARQGLSVPQYVKALLEEHVPGGDTAASPSPKERSGTFQEWAATHNMDNPLLAEETLKRERR